MVPHFVTYANNVRLYKHSITTTLYNDIINQRAQNLQKNINIYRIIINCFNLNQANILLIILWNTSIMLHLF